MDQATQPSSNSYTTRHLRGIFLFANKLPCRARSRNKPSPGASSLLLSPLPEGEEGRRNRDSPISQQHFTGPSIKGRNGEGLEESSLPGTAGLSCQCSSGMTCSADPSTAAPATRQQDVGYERGREGWQEQDCLVAWLRCTTPRTVLSITRGERRGLPDSGKVQTFAPGFSDPAATALQHAPTSTKPHALKEPPAGQGGRLRG